MKAVSYLAPNWMDYYQTIAEAIGRSLRCEVEFRACDRGSLEDLHEHTDRAQAHSTADRH